jgi:hypothetical protein
MTERTAWVIRDYSVDPMAPEEYFWDINPNAFSMSYRKSLTYDRTCAEDGRSIIFEGRDEPQRMQFSGVLLLQDQYDKFVEWYSKRTQIELEDDLGRTFWVYIVSFEPSRKRSTQHPWRHEYSGEFAVLDWAS